MAYDESTRMFFESASRAFRRVAICCSSEQKDPLTTLTTLKPCVASDLPRIARDLCLAQRAVTSATAKRDVVVDALLSHTVGCAMADAHQHQQQEGSSVSASALVGCCSLCLDDVDDVDDVDDGEELKPVKTVPAASAAASGVVYLCCDCSVAGRLWHREFLSACNLDHIDIDLSDMSAGDLAFVPDWREFMAFQCINAVMCWPADRALNANVSALVRRDRELLMYNLRTEFVFIGEHCLPITQTFFLSRLPADQKDERSISRTWGFFFGTNAIIVPVHQGLVVAAPCEPTKFRKSKYWIECSAKGLRLDDGPMLTSCELHALTVQGTDTPE